MRAVEKTGSKGLWREVFRARRTVHRGNSIVASGWLGFRGTNSPAHFYEARAGWVFDHEIANL